jgi:hypothetical protein
MARYRSKEMIGECVWSWRESAVHGEGGQNSVAIFRVGCADEVAWWRDKHGVDRGVAYEGAYGCTATCAGTSAS